MSEGNACSWRAPLVTLATGERVPSDSPLWASECEARAIWSMTDEKRDAFLETCERRRGAESVRELKERIRELEPYFVLGLPTREQRRAYAAKVEARRGVNAREHLEFRVREIWAARKVEAA